MEINKIQDGDTDNSSGIGRRDLSVFEKKGEAET